MRAVIAVYIAAMVTANLLVWWLGPWFSPINAFLLIGLDLTLRDVMHDRLTKWQMLGVVLAGGALTWLLNPSAGHIAMASAVAFTASAVADWLAYTALRSKPWMVRANGSNLVGAAVDSALFPTLAFGAFMPHIVALQFVAKVAGGAVWSVLLKKAMPA
jgi:queuosine precursor transporter